jgi:sigma-B regulation protein RsbU (phosphoserine phosphatase)
MSTTIRPLPPDDSRDSRGRNLLLSLLRGDVASHGPAWLPLVLILGGIGVVAYADHLVVSISLIYLYILPLAVGAIFLRGEVSYILIVLCVLFHDYDSPRALNPGLRIFHNLSAILCFAFVVYLIQRYMEQREALAKTVEQQRDELLNDVELAAQVQRMFLPLTKPTIPGFQFAGMMLPARGVGGDYYDYIPIDDHTVQVVVADVSGKGVPAALLMSATAAAMQLEANHERNMKEMLGRLNSGILAVSDGEHYVTLMVAEIDARKGTLQHVNCGHNPGLHFHAKTGQVTCMNSSCLPIGLQEEENCELASAELGSGDVVVFYTDGITEAENQQGKLFGVERLSAVVRRGSSLSAEDLMIHIYNAAADFCGDAFNDDVTIVVVKYDFELSPSLAS